MNIEKYRTNVKYNKPVLEASGKKGNFDSMAVDGPFVFYHNDKYYMMYVGFDGLGYQTGLAVSEDLLHWEEEAVILKREDAQKRNSWDKIGIAGVWILRNNDLHEQPVLKKIDGKYWMVYHSYPMEGYESGPAEIGLAYTEDETLHNWVLLDHPILSWRDGNEWEQAGLYKGCMVENNGKYYMFYNAKNSENWVWNEQIGLAVSEDMIHWERVGIEPIIKNTPYSWDSNFCADPCVVKDHDKWVMFYYGYNGCNAQEGIAFSDDLLNWEKYSEPILKAGEGNSIDTIHAHKPSVIEKNGGLYHFYCAVRESRPTDRCVNIDPTKPDLNNKTEYRCITVAMSKEEKNEEKN